MEPARILIVSSIETIRRVVATVLSSEGYEVLTAADIAAGLRLLAEKRVDLLLLERRLAGPAGVALLKEVRQAAGRLALPVIVVTQTDRDDELEQALAAGADDYLCLPVSPSVVKARVNAALRVARAQTEMRRARERYRVAAQAAECGLWEWDILRDRFYLTQPLQQLLALEGPLPCTLNEFLDLVHAEDVDQLREAIQKHAGGYTELLECELRMATASGPARWFLCRGHVIGGERGWAERLVGAFVDISQRKHMEALLRISLQENSEQKTGQFA